MIFKSPQFLSLLILSFIDALGMGIIFPILPELFYNLKYGLFVNNSDYNILVYYGIALAAYPAGSLIGMPFLGYISDNFSRKTALVLSLCVACCGFLISSFAVLLSLPMVFILSRAICGFCTGNYAIINATVLDLHPNVKDRSNIFKFPLLFFLLGAAVGPILGGVCLSFESNKWVFSLPFLITLGLSFANLIIIWFLFHDKVNKEKVQKGSYKKLISKLLNRFCAQK